MSFQNHTYSTAMQYASVLNMQNSGMKQRSDVIAE